MARPMKPLVRSGGYYPSRKWIPLVYQGGYTTANGGEQPEPEAVLKTVTGSLIHITDALALPAEALTVNVEPIQDLNGYDSPWPAGGGKNKFDPSAMPTPTSTIQYHAFYVGDGDWIASTDAPYVSGNATVFFLAGDVSSGASTSGNGISPSSGRKQTAVDGYVTIAWRALDSVDPSQYHIQIESGSVVSTWTPYSNICPISGRTSATVTRTGKNLWNGTLANNAYVQFETRVGVTYTVSAKRIDSTVGTYFYVTKKLADESSWTQVGKVITNNTITPITFTAEDGYVYSLWSNSTYTNVAEIQIELGSTATAYEPYAGNTYTIALGDTVYGGTLDVTGGVLTVDRAMVDLGTLDWYYREAFSGFSAPFTPEAKTAFTAICSAYPFVGAYSLTSDKTCGYIYEKQVFVKDYDYTDAATFKAAMPGVQLCYELATPIEITLTPTQIEMLLGENNLWADAGDSTLTYYAEGEASTSEALGILLGGTYNNPGGADDVSDDEALGILLGGS